MRNLKIDEREGKLVFDEYANTEVYTQDGIGYALKEDGTAEVVGTSVIMADLESIRIPKTVNGHTVTAVGTSAFGVYSGLEFVFLPDSVQTIGNCAFEGCIGLKYLRIPDGVTSIEPSVFLNCISLTDVTIPDSVTVIEDQAFNSCRSLTKVGIPDGTVEIGNYAFWSFSNVESISMPEGLTRIGSAIFNGCSSNFTVLRFPSTLQAIDEGAFYYLDYLIRDNSITHMDVYCLSAS